MFAMRAKMISLAKMVATTIQRTARNAGALLVLQEKDVISFLEEVSGRFNGTIWDRSQGVVGAGFVHSAIEAVNASTVAASVELTDASFSCVDARFSGVDPEFSGVVARLSGVYASFSDARFNWM